MLGSTRTLTVWASSGGAEEPTVLTTVSVPRKCTLSDVCRPLEDKSLLHIDDLDRRYHFVLGGDAIAKHFCDAVLAPESDDNDYRLVLVSGEHPERVRRRRVILEKLKLSTRNRIPKRGGDVTPMRSTRKRRQHASTMSSLPLSKRRRNRKTSKDSGLSSPPGAKVVIDLTSPVKAQNDSPRTPRPQAKPLGLSSVGSPPRTGRAKRDKVTPPATAPSKTMPQNLNSRSEDSGKPTARNIRSLAVGQLGSSPSPASRHADDHEALAAPGSMPRSEEHRSDAVVGLDKTPPPLFQKSARSLTARRQRERSVKRSVLMTPQARRSWDSAGKGERARIPRQREPSARPTAGSSAVSSSKVQSRASPREHLSPTSRRRALENLELEDTNGPLRDTRRALRHGSGPAVGVKTTNEMFTQILDIMQDIKISQEELLARHRLFCAAQRERFAAQRRGLQERWLKQVTDRQDRWLKQVLDRHDGNRNGIPRVPEDCNLPSFFVHPKNPRAD